MAVLRPKRSPNVPSRGAPNSMPIKLPRNAGPNAFAGRCQLRASSGAAEASAEISKPSASIARNDHSKRFTLNQTNLCSSTKASISSRRLTLEPSRSLLVGVDLDQAIEQVAPIEQGLDADVLIEAVNVAEIGP